MADNPLKYDPTRTVTLRKAFLADMARRFAAIRRATVQLILEEDAFGLKPANKVGAAVQGSTISLDKVLGPVVNTRWKFETDDGKVEAYRTWLQQMVDTNLLEQTATGEPWTQEYFQPAYAKGLARSYMDTKGAATGAWEFFEGGKQAFLDMAFAGPVAESKLKMLGTRNFTALKGITAQMDAELSRTLATGLAGGEGAYKVARDMANSITGIERKRARTMARTELVHAHAEGQLDSFEMLGVDELGVMSEWSTAGDDKVCKVCLPLEGAIFTVKEARGLIPRHPNCRCAWIPAVTGEHKGGTTTTQHSGPGQGLAPPGTKPTGKKFGQKFSKDEIQSRLRDSLQAETGLKGAAARKASRWAGADKQVSGKLKPGSKAYADAQATKQAEAAAAAAKAKKEAAAEAAAKKAEHSFKVKAGMTKKKYGLTDDMLQQGSDAQTSVYMPGTKMQDYVAGKGYTATAGEIQDLITDKIPAKLQGQPGKHYLTAQMEALDDFIGAKAAAAKAAKEAAEAAAAKAAKAAHAHKIKLGMAKKQWSKPKYGGGLVDSDYGGDGKLTLGGMGKVLAEKGWATDTVGTPTLAKLFDAADLVEQKAIMDGLKKAPALKGTVSKVPANLVDFDGGLNKAGKAFYAGVPYDEIPDNVLGSLNAVGGKATTQANILKGWGEAKQATKAAELAKVPDEYLSASGKNLSPAGMTHYAGETWSDLPEDLITKVLQTEGPEAQAKLLQAHAAKKAAAVPDAVPEVPAKYHNSTGSTLNPEGVKFYAGVESFDLPDDVFDDVLNANSPGEAVAVLKTWKETQPTTVPKPSAVPDDLLHTDGTLSSDGIKHYVGVSSLNDVDNDLMDKLLFSDLEEQLELIKEWKGEVAIAAKPPQVGSVVVPAEGSLKKIKDLPGSTRPYLAKDTTGKQWVVKDVGVSGIDPDHLRSEGLADELYRVAGFDVPEGAVVDTPSGPMKITEYLEGGQTLGAWQKQATASEVQRMRVQLRKGFVMDALMANHDVAGLNNDNIFVVAGKAYRIDNGGALVYRAQGGAKATWGPKVKELASMRDPKVNKQTAAIYAGITDDEIHEQIRHIVAKRQRILDAIPDPDIRATMAARIDDLRAQLPAQPTTAAPTGLRRAEYGITPATTSRVKAARSNGTNIAGDRDMIEDNNLLAWEELDSRGKPLTKVQFKVTKKGSDSIVQNLGDELQAAQKTGGPVSNVHPQDTHWDAILKGVKTVNLHAKDGNYNTGTLQALKNEHDAIKVKLAQGATGDTKEMLEHYDEAISTILKAKEAGGITPKLGQYVYTPPKPKPAPKRRGRAVRVRRDAEIDFRTVEFTDGRGKQQATRNTFSTDQAYTIDMDDDIEVKFIPNDGNYSRASGRALHGTVSITVPEGVSETSLQKALAVVEDLGIDAQPPSPAYEEALYLHRTIYMRQKHTDSRYARIWGDESITDEEKVTKIKAWVKDEMGIDVDTVPTYDPHGVAKHADGSGFRHWERWDVTPDDLAEEMGDYALLHTTGGLGDSSRGRVAVTLGRILDSGGEFTSTAGRIRKGVDVRSTGGASTGSDMNTGGASYFFTRIKPVTATEKGFYFRIGALARQDAISYSGDNFGAISAIKSRAYTVRQYKDYARNSGNETIFKEGLSIDDIDYIRVADSDERRDVLAVFKQRGMTHLPDGRAVEDVVITGRTKPKKRKLK